MYECVLIWLLLNQQQPDENYFLSDDEKDKEEVEADAIMELPVPETETSSPELEDSVVIRQEEFPEVDSGNKKAEEELKNKKVFYMNKRTKVLFYTWVIKHFFFLFQYFLLNAVCCSLVNKSNAPGQQDWDSEDSVWTSIKNLAKDISDSDPQFLLKVCGLVIKGAFI